MLDEPDRARKTDRKATITTLAVILLLSGGYDFWRGYKYHQSLYERIMFAILGFIVLAIVFALFSGRR